MSNNTTIENVMDESHDDFMVRFRKMSSAGYRPQGIENPRATTVSKTSAISAQNARRSQRKDVMGLVALGRKDSEIADELGIAEDTVRTLRISRM